MSGWIGVDLDGTLAEYHGWQGEDHIGAPVPTMVERVEEWLAKGREVRIFTARVYGEEMDTRGYHARHVIEKWCEEHIGQKLPVTNEKDYGMIELWDDRAIAVVPNTGVRIGAPR